MTEKSNMSHKIILGDLNMNIKYLYIIERGYGKV